MDDSYINIDIRITRIGRSNTYKVQIDSIYGQAEHQFRYPFKPYELEAAIAEMGRNRGRAVRAIDGPEMGKAKEVGSKLFESLFGGEARESLRHVQSQAEKDTKRVRYRLRLNDAPTLADLPWEYLYDRRENHFLSLSVESSLVRYLELTTTVPRLAVTPPLRMLVVIANPVEVTQLDVDTEWKHLEASLNPLVSRGELEIRRLDHPTISNLRQALQRRNYHILHFIGHGRYDPDIKDGQLLFEDEFRGSHRVSGQDLGMLLYDYRRSLRLVVLNACEGGRADVNDPFSGVAQSLVQKGLPAVIAMQFEISDRAARIFSRVFYSNVAHGHSIDASLAEARKDIRLNHPGVEWGTAVLYMHHPDGHLFQLPKRDEDRPITTPASVLAQKRRKAEEAAKRLEQERADALVEQKRLEEEEAAKQLEQERADALAEQKRSEEEAEAKRLEQEHTEALAKQRQREAEEAEARRLEQERADVEAKRLEQERLEQERTEALAELKQREEAEAEAKRLEQQHVKALAEQKRFEEEKAEARQLAKERAEALAEQKRLEEAEAEANRIEQERVEAIAEQKRREEAKRLEAERLEQERLEQERATAIAAQKRREAAEAASQLEQERAEELAEQKRREDVEAKLLEEAHATPAPRYERNTGELAPSGEQVVKVPSSSDTIRSSANRGKSYAPVVVVLGILVMGAILFQQAEARRLFEIQQEEYVRAQETAEAIVAATALPQIAEGEALLDAFDVEDAVLGDLHYHLPETEPRIGVSEPGKVGDFGDFETWSPAYLDNFIAVAKFRSPPLAAGWTYGYIFRDTGGNENYRLYIDFNGNWRLGYGPNNIVDEGGSDQIRRGVNQINTLTLVAMGSEGKLYLNDTFVSNLNLSERSDLEVGTSSVSPAFGFYADEGEYEMTLLKYDIWELIARE